MSSSRLPLRPFSPSDPARIDARADFALEHRLCGEPLFGPERPAGPCWTLTDGPGRWARPLAVGGLEPQGAGRFGAWLYAADLTPRQWGQVRAAFRRALAETGARRVEVTVRDAGVLGPCRAAVWAQRALGLSFEGRMRGWGADGVDYLLYAGVFQ